MSPVEQNMTMKDLKTSDPRWCTGCGDYSILVGLRKFMVNHQLERENTMNVSGIGCSGRIPHYMNTYGIHSLHGRAVPVALGVALARPDLNVFIHSGDGDSLSIGGNHLMHGISKNFNCVYLLYDNQIYGLTKNQTSPTSRKGLSTQTQPGGSFLEPINPVRFALGLGASFVASTADWLGAHLTDTLDRAFAHKGFSFVHIAQRCPKFNPSAWDFQDSSWMTFITDEEEGVMADKKAGSATVVEHSPRSLEGAFKWSNSVPNVFGIFYKQDKPVYDAMMHTNRDNAEKRSRSDLLDAYTL